MRLHYRQIRGTAERSCDDVDDLWSRGKFNSGFVLHVENSGLLLAHIEIRFLIVLILWNINCESFGSTRSNITIGKLDDNAQWYQ
jgi:hypothetical protein